MKKKVNRFNCVVKANQKNKYKIDIDYETMKTNVINYLDLNELLKKHVQSLEKLSS
ncbi:hypothetical protein [Mycoplasma sp. P36-A1]|uniref:hypothetical protein n=1 Tax=Mycoplasma sp. P36-A1 TaxID=3252900 RepID=UPI003C2CAAD3